MISPASVQLFSGLQHKEIKVIVAAARRRTFEASQIIVTAHEPAKSLFLVAAGCVDYYVTNEAGHDILLRRLIAGDVFGVGSMLSKPIGYIGTAKAVEHVRVLEWKDRVIRQLARTYPQLTENALRTVLRYLAMYARRHIALVSNTAQERLACALSSLGSRTGHAVPTGVEIGVKNEDLASLADVSFFTASRVLKDWDRHGVVEKSRGKVIIRSPEKLLAA
jgi:CRP/FNR family transcriptional regulator, nitrogen oxide reductase regulator